MNKVSALNSLTSKVVCSRDFKWFNKPGAVDTNSKSSATITNMGNSFLTNL